MSARALDTQNAPRVDAERAGDERIALGKQAFKHALLDNLLYVQGKTAALATKNDYYMALAYTVRDRMLHRWISTTSLYTREGSRTVAYLSAEFLMGPHLGNNLVNLGIYNEVRQVVGELGLDFDELLALEEEPGLGSGGLGRLLARLAPRQVNLALPRFRVTSGFALRPLLAALGMPLAFSPDADFSGITTAQRLRIDEVAHKAYIDVNEEGTEAAAATAVIIKASARFMNTEPPVEMIVDRPFLFAITDTESGLPLFLGRVTDPTAG